jgi:hypothetical protein
MAQNTNEINYVRCAEVLRDSIYRAMPDEKVTIITSDMLPYGDTAIDPTWKLSNDWQVYEASPYEYTIKLEADMYVPRRIDHWWDILRNRDLNISTTIRNHNNVISNERMYRQIFDRSNLPDTYNAITYFRKSEIARDFYYLVKDIFENWKEYKSLLDYCPDDNPTTDIVYAIAAITIGVENCTLPAFTDMSMIHMKPAIVNSITNKWYDEFVYEIYDDVLRINTIPQLFPFHYHNKEFSNIIMRELGHG